MGSVTDSITNLFRSQPSIAQQLLAVQRPCRAGGGNRNIRIRIIDPQTFMNDMATPQDVVNDLQTFLNGLDATPGIDTAIATALATYNFTVTYETSAPTQAQIDNAAVNDFPIYFLTATGVFQSSTDSVVKLLVSNRIPVRTFVGRRIGALTQPVPSVVDTYKNFEDDWANSPTVLGFGVPGTYFAPNNPRPNENQWRCRKIGIIKMQGGMIENLAFPQRRAKIVSVLRHELGHMFGLPHLDNTMMDGNYDVNATFSQFTNDQLWVVMNALDNLTR